ncbi:MAG: four helix bundle protein [Armatimonadetes bacterium]|nr:four helix bundle protein [Armatimonadota bacterium]
MGAEIENTDLYQKSCSLADRVWADVCSWEWLAKKTVGAQLVSSVDSIAANLVEGDGREMGKDALRFLIIARSSARETRHWIARAQARKLVEPNVADCWTRDLEEVLRMLRSLITCRMAKVDGVKEPHPTYGQDDIWDWSNWPCALSNELHSLPDDKTQTAAFPVPSSLGPYVPYQVEMTRRSRTP